MNSGKTTSNTLLDRLHGQDQEAWARLWHLYAPLVHYWCLQGGVPVQDTADIQQEVFSAVASGLERFRRDRPGDTFRGWLRGITRHKLLDYHERRRNQPLPQGGTTAQHLLQQVAQPEWSLDEPAEQVNQLFLRAVELVRGEFEVRTWTAFWRAAVDGHAPADIAADLHTTPAAVRKAKSRVLHRLRQEMGDLVG